MELTPDTGRLYNRKVISFQPANQTIRSSATQSCARVCLCCSLLLSFAFTAWAQSPTSVAVQVRDHLQRAQAALQTRQVDVAAKELQAVLLLEPNNVEAHSNLGVLLFFRGDCQTASQHFELALSARPTLPKAEALLGICDKRLGKSSASNRLENSFAKLDDARLRTEVGRELASLYYQQKEIGRSVVVMQKLVELNPDSVEVLYMAQRIYAELADDTLNKLVVVAPNSARMQQVIAQRLVNAGDLPGAMAHYRKALELDSRLPGLHYELAEAMLESAPADNKVQAEAELEIEQSVRIDGNSSRVECLKGRIAMQRSDMGQGFAHYSSAFALNPLDAEAQLGLGRLLMSMKKPQEARKYLELAVQSDALNGEAHYRLALTYGTLQMTTESQREMRLFQEIKKTKDQIKELYRQMNKSLKSPDELPAAAGKTAGQDRP